MKTLYVIEYEFVAPWFEDNDNFDVLLGMDILSQGRLTFEPGGDVFIRVRILNPYASGRPSGSTSTSRRPTWSGALTTPSFSIRSISRAALL